MRYFICLILVLASRCWGVAFVRASTPATTTSGPMTITVAVDAGSCVVVEVALNGFQTINISSITDSGSTYTQSTKVINGVANQNFLWTATSATASSSLTVTFSTTYTGAVGIASVYSGCSGTHANNSTSDAFTGTSPNLALTGMLAGSWCVEGTTTADTPTVNQDSVGIKRGSATQGVTGFLADSPGPCTSGGVMNISLGTSQAYATGIVELTNSAPGRRPLAIVF